MFRLASLVFLVASSWCDAHRTIPDGSICGPQFSSPDTALTIPNPKVSWASYRTFTCEEPIFWLEAEADAGQTLHFSAMVPVIERFDDVRMSVAIIGPSLPALTADVDVPDEIKDYISTSGSGVILFKSPQNQTTCDHLTGEPLIMESSVVDGRCLFYERFGGSNSWTVLDETFNVTEAGLYKIAVFVEGGTTAKAAFACCDWPEDFVTNYDMPENECTLCGTTNSENPAWASHFYEQKTMAEYGGFPPAANCSDADALSLEPAEDQCPPPPEVNTEIQPSSCALGCNSEGECHSHNALGECTHQLKWDMNPMFGEAPVSKVIIFKGDKINFGCNVGCMAHNLFEMAGQSSLDQCDFTDATAIAGVEEVALGHILTFDEEGTFHYSCGISCTGFPDVGISSVVRQGFDPDACHCSLGQKLTVEVKDSSEGLRCHDHAKVSKEDTASLSCADGEVLAVAIDNPGYGAMDATKCAELCTPEIALNFMQGVEMGSCSEKGFLFNAVKTTVTPPGSPLEFEVLVTSNEDEESTCHCHSYEEIACPEDELPDDTLYVEHIDELNAYCMGVVDGSENICPYKCFQPMEVLHLHYLECESRVVDPTYIAVNATNLCHIAATARAGDECPVVNLGEPNLGGGPDPGDPDPDDGLDDGEVDDGEVDDTSGALKTQGWAVMLTFISFFVIRFL